MSSRGPAITGITGPGEMRSPLSAAEPQGSDPLYFRRFPVFVIGFAAFWLGFIAPFDALWASRAGLGYGLVSPGHAACVGLLGFALLAARSHPAAGRIAAFVALLVGLVCPWLAADQHLYFYNHIIDRLWPLVFAGLALAVILATLSERLRAFSRSICFASAVPALAFVLWAPPLHDGLFVHGNRDILYFALALLLAASIISLSRRYHPEAVYAERVPFLVAMGGPFIAVACWYGLVEEGRYSLQITDGSGSLLVSFLPNLLFLGGILFSILLSRSLKLSLVLGTHARELEYQSLHDTLTGLPNKLMVSRSLSELCRSIQLPGAVLWVVAVDLNGLKLINDSVGHAVGDQVLAEAARRIVAHAPGANLVARVEGDEFVLAFLNRSNQQVAEVVKDVMDAVGRPYHFNEMQLRVTASAGITATRQSVPDSMELVREAELAMAWAERDGQNSLHLYTPELSTAVQQRLTLRTELQHALEHAQFELYYQPIVDARAGQIVGAEALLRWPHPTRGLVSPRSFIKLAEDTGQIVPLSNWVLDTACRDISRLRERNHATFPVVVNVSPLHFRRSDFVDVLRRALERYELGDGALDLEITEGMVIDQTDAMFQKLNLIRDLGVKVSIDDFGTGYSSLGYLKSLPIDKIKIDQSFVNDVISDRRDAAITKAIIGLAHHLNLKVVAEGVETESQFWFLKRNFCDEVQGYLFQRPVPFDDFSQLLYEKGGRVILPTARMSASPDKVLLLLDDEPNILRALSRLLRRDGYRILTANTPQQAFALLAENDVQVVMSDQRMPEMTGTEFFRRVKEMYPDTIRLILSGYTDLKSVTDAINHGAIYRFLTKPWDDEELRREIAEAFKGYQAQDSGA